MRIIKLTEHKFAIVDDEDYTLVSKLSWRACWNGYTWYARSSTDIFMHKLLIPDSDYVDHRDSNGLNNQRKNIRSCTATQNRANSRPGTNKSSRYKGVSFCTRTYKFRAQICRAGKPVYIGRFTSEEDAARAYDEKAKELFGEFARLNF